MGISFRGFLSMKLTGYIELDSVKIWLLMPEYSDFIYEDGELRAMNNDFMLLGVF